MAHHFKILTPPLHAIGQGAIKWFQDNWGITTSAIKIEEEIDPDVNLRPTFSAHTRDHHILCVEVSANIYPNYLDAFVLSCRDKGLPIKLFVAVNKGMQEPNYAQGLKAAKRAGVGIIEVDDKSGVVIQNALSLSLTGLRTFEVTRFPKKFRQNISHAELTFRDGTPEKACSLVFDEIESLFRKFAKKAEAKGWWLNKGGVNIEKVPWANLIGDLDKNLDRKASHCTGLTPAFMGRILGTTPFRNDSGHKPSNLKALAKRDKELRTRCESAADLFYDLVKAIKPAGV